MTLVATENGRILGHILFSGLPIEVDGGVLRAAALAPLAVLPERQGQGIGTALEFVPGGLDGVAGTVRYAQAFGLDNDIS